MFDIRHRIGIRADINEVYDAVATVEGLARWWTSDVRGESRPGSLLTFGFGGPEAVAVMEVTELSAPTRVVWRGVGGPDEWKETTFTFELKSNGDMTILLFTNAGWRTPVEFIYHCSTKWAYYLLGLKTGLEGGTSAPWPDDLAIGDWG